MDSFEAHDDVILLATAVRRGVDPRLLQRKAERGELVRIRPGVYAHGAWWRTIDGREQHLWRIRAFERVHPGSVYCQRSAAAILGLPILGEWGALVHTAIETADGGRSAGSARRHALRLEDHEVTRTAGLTHTTALRTAADISASSSFRAAVVSADAALRHSGVTDDSVAAAIEGWRGRKHGRAVERALTFASAMSESPGESLSRATIELLGFPRPVLQSEYTTPLGTFRPDFAWPDYGVLGEFDGQEKYLRHAPAKGQSVADAVISEKRREDLLRSMTRSAFARWGWKDALTYTGLEAELTRAGLVSLR